MLGVSPLSPALLDGLGLSRLQVGLLLPAIYAGGLVFSLPGGRLADRVGLRVSFLGGLAVAGVPLLLAAAAPNFHVFLAALLIAGVGWSLVNPALGKAIMELFPPEERGVAMGIKQMGLTVGGIAAALVLPPVAAGWGWRAGMALCAFVVAIPAVAAWRPLGACPPWRPDRGPAEGEGPESSWWWLARPALLILFASGLALGMVQSAVLGYLPLFAIQGQRFGPAGAGALLATAQAGGALSRLGLGAASDRWSVGQRWRWLVVTSGLATLAFGTYALWAPSSALLATPVAFCAGVGAFGWVGLYLIISAEAGGSRQAGLLTGVGMAFIIMGLLAGAPLFGVILERSDSYALPWAVFALLSLAVASALGGAGAAIRRGR